MGVTGLPSDDAVLRAVVEHDGGDFAKVKRITIGFAAVPSLIAGKVDAVVAFWNAEGVALQAARRADARVPRRRLRRAALPGAGAGRPRSGRWRDRRDEVETTLGRLRRRHERRAARPPGDGRRRSSRRRAPTRTLMRAQLDAVGPALLPPIRLDRDALERWARFDARFGILKRPPDVNEAFPP